MRFPPTDGATPGAPMVTDLHMAMERRPRKTRMAEITDELAQYSKLAIETAARELKVPSLALARRLNQAEIARLVHLLNAALPHVDHKGLRHRIEDLLEAVTDGRMPDQRPESELDWALKTARRRREEKSREGLDETNEDQTDE